MPKGKEQVFADFVQFTVQQGYGVGYIRDSHQSVPPDCGFVRFRYPGGGLFTAAGIVQFRQREDGATACKAFVERSDEPMELQMNFPRESPHSSLHPRLPMRTRPPRIGGVGGNAPGVYGGPRWHIILTEGPQML